MKRHEQAIEKATKSINQAKDKVSKNYWRLNYHVASPAYWINDPNGFIFYKGEYHLFYQHHPFTSQWGPMHWGHVKSKDLTFWEHLPVALAPSEEYDKDGCFSGSAIEKDGKLYLMYTGHKWTGENHDTDLEQVQCLAVSEDGVSFKKIASNPVIKGAPEGDIHPHHIRDPKVWKHGDYYYCVIGNKTKEEVGQVLLYRSEDLLEWEFLNIVAKGGGNFGFMWECPDLFHLDGHDILMMSPQGMVSEGHLYQNLHQSGYVLGKLDYESGKLDHGSFRLLDYGFDFYAPQSTIDDQGRRVMVAWMAMWESEMPEQEFDWAGAMTLPRQLFIEDGQIISKPMPEVEKLRNNLTQFENVIFDGKRVFEGVSGYCLELDIVIDAKEATQFGLRLRVNDESKEETVLSYDCNESFLTLDRNKSGKGLKGIRKAPVELKDNQLHLRVFLDKSSIEIFINGGEKVMTSRIYPSESSTGIEFFAKGPISINSLKKWNLDKSVDVITKYSKSMAEN
ncbi:glycoside hydrolase family 32 protein [Alkalihalobacillus sp. BA299]|uniref:glycoside hydrolase family 32 protein n=1 Tax=Alkalihalobacillus sp. BA299 TaxID=2815938 RepID=UPI001ADB9349|nr:glycoside hydrolase family 32 protein [Alkalihalobacillus sp. BA299]